MHARMSVANFRHVARREHSAALEEYCSTLASIANTLGRGLQPTLHQLELAQAAKLRLENARTLLQLSVDVAIDDVAVQRHHRVH